MGVATRGSATVRGGSLVLFSIWLGFGVLMLAISRYDLGGVIWHVYLPGVLLTLFFVAGLVASRRFTAVWDHGFVPTIPIPGWMWIGVVGGVLAAIVLSVHGPIPTAAAVWLGCWALGTAYALSILTEGDVFRRAVAWPIWITIFLIALLLGTIGIGAMADNASILTVIFYLALLLFTFHVWFVLPFSLYQAAATEEVSSSAVLPPIDVLIPAYQEKGVVGDCIEAVLNTTYPEEKMNILVIDDGSTDGTFEEAAQFRDRNVRVIRRKNGGKPRALNLGIQCTTNPVVVTVDADSRPEPRTIGRMVRQLQANPEVGALSAAVLPINDTSVIGALQRLEYAVSNTNRRAYSAFGAVPVVPGCCGVYRRAALEDVWGYDPDTVTEDFDITVKLLKAGWIVRHGAGTVWTIAPSGWRALWRQRLRWYRGGFQTIRKHREVLRSPQYGYLHALTLPVRTVSQLFTPLASFVILGAVVWGLVTGPSTYLLVLLALFFMLTMQIGAFTVVLEDEPWWTVAYAPFLFVGYKHFVDATVGIGSIRAMLTDTTDW